ncbi:ATP-grasp domain-containing protein [Actinokineospora sp. NBRC 105648]|uniref:ATP-grasp domain-containing protein n=1 Tax=Actinokineospora sp. NBRC 105648 TaxID=3032206 RepID=UPI0024A5D169|nr:ATP-grasp domain-containing protein [Actinokineospora sp. NBRC 105648]GLZ40465.1 hypothetical protein Acsp05_40890 [Actinokineospora sp. NBRC 105648]
MTTLLFVGGAGHGALGSAVAALALSQARDRGIGTHLLADRASLAASSAVAALADDATELDFTDAPDCVAWATDQARRGNRFDLVLGVREYAQVTVAEVAAALGVPGNPPAAVRRVRAKDACRAALVAAGFDQPAFRLCGTTAEAGHFLARSRGPWVVKPRDAMGSLGVRRVEGPTELAAAVAGLPRPFLVEEFVRGREYSVEGYFRAGLPHVLAVTEKQVTAAPAFVEEGHVLPARLPAATRAEIERQVRTALRALRLRYGLFHVELWHTAAGVVLGEVHARPGGDWIHQLLRHAIPGLDLFGLVYDDALGTPRHPGVPTQAAAARYLFAPPGRVSRVDGWTRVCDHPAVLVADLLAEPGTDVVPAVESSDRAGAVVVGANTAGEAATLADRLASSVSFVVDARPARLAGHRPPR